MKKWPLMMVLSGICVSQIGGEAGCSGKMQQPESSCWKASTPVTANAWQRQTLRLCPVCAQMKALQEENRALRQDNTTLQGEVEQMNRVASYVGSRVAKVLAGARRANNYNAALVGELKRWNRKLEVDIVLPLRYSCHVDAV